MFKGSCFVLALCCYVSFASAEVPERLHYQGYLTNAAGEAINCSDPIQCQDSYTLTFRFYATPAAEVAVWEETHANVSIYEGIFHVALGSETSLTASDLANSRHLGITVNEIGELLPRQTLASAPFAMRASLAEQSLEADNASQLGGIEAAEYILSPDLKDGDDDTLQSLTCLTGAIPVWTGSIWACGTDQVGGDDTTLSEEEVDAMVANNGYAAQTDVDLLANNLNVVSGNLEAALNTLEGVQSDLSTLDATTGGNSANIDALQSLVTGIQADISTLQSNVGSLAPIAISGSFTSLVDVPSGLADGDDDVVAGLSCAAGQVPKWDGSAWSCADDAGGAVGTVEPAPCDATTVGEMYFDQVGNALRLCDGTDYRKIKLCTEVCPPSSAVVCDLPIEDDCGSACGGLGTGLNSSQCASPSTVACGGAIIDECGNTCVETGTALNTDQCDPTSSACGGPVTDDCGNLCVGIGLACADGLACYNGSCVVNTSCKSIIAGGGSEGNGIYIIDPDAGGPIPPFTATCDMTTDGGGWTQITIDYLRLNASLTTQCNVPESHGFVNGNTLFYGYPESHDNEAWNDFDLHIDYTQIRGVVFFYASSGSVAGWTQSGANPDNNNYGIQSDTSYSTLNVTGTGGNKSWHRWGKPGQVFHAYNQLGWEGEWYDIKTLTFGTIFTVTGSVLRFSTFSESGSIPNERWSFQPMVFIR